MDNNSTPSYLANNQLRMVAVSSSTTKKPQVIANKRGASGKKTKSGGQKEYQQIVAQSKQSEPSKLAAHSVSLGMNPSTRPAHVGVQSLKHASQQSQLSHQRSQKTYPQQAPRVSQDQIKLVGSQTSETGKQSYKQITLQPPPYLSAMPSSQMTMSQSKKSAKQAANQISKSSKGEAQDANRQTIGHKSHTNRKQLSSKLQSRKSSKTAAQGQPSIDNGSENAYSTSNQHRGQIITFNDRGQDENDAVVPRFSQHLQQHTQQIQTLQTIQTERETRMGNEDHDPIYDFLPGTRSKGANAHQSALLTEAQRDLRTYSTNQDQLLLNPLLLDLQSKFAELRQQLFQEIETINTRLLNIEATVLAQRGGQANQGLGGHSPRMASASKNGTANLAGFADTVKVTFSNARADVDTEAVKGRGKAKRAGKKKGAEVGHENEDDNEIVDINNYFLVPSHANSTRAKDSGAARGLAGGGGAGNAAEADSRYSSGKSDNFRRSLRELHGRNAAKKLEAAPSGPQSAAAQKPQLEEEADGDDLLNQMIFEVKSPIQQELRLSKVASQGRAPTANYMLKEKGQISSSQRQQMRLTQQRGRDHKPSPSNHTQSSKSIPGARAFERREQNNNKNGQTTKQKQNQFIVPKQNKAGSSLSQSRKEKIIELNQKLLKSPNLYHGGRLSNLEGHISSQDKTGTLGPADHLLANESVDVPDLKPGLGDLEYKDFLENEDRQASGSMMANFGTFGGKGRHNPVVQWTEGAEASHQMANVNPKDDEGRRSLLQKQRSELQPSKAQGKLQASQGQLPQYQRISGGSRSNAADHSLSQQQLFLGGGSLQHQPMHHKMSHPQLMSSSTFSNGDGENGADDFDEKMDQRQYQHNISNKSNPVGAEGQDQEGRRQPVELLGRHPLNNGQPWRRPAAENEDDDDDGGFLSDEVDERRSYTPQPRGTADNTVDQKFEKSIQNGGMEIQSITLENEAINNETILNLSKISKINDQTMLGNTSLRNMSKNPSTIMPSLGQNLLAGSSGQHHGQQKNASVIGFMGQPAGLAGQQQAFQQQNLASSGSNSFVAGLQGLAGVNALGGRKPGRGGPAASSSIQSTSQHRQLQMKKPGTAMSSLSRAQDGQNEKASARSGNGASVPLTARVSSNNMASGTINQSNEPRVKSLQRQPIVGQTEARSGVNMIYKSPVRNVGGAAASMGKPRSAYGGDARQGAASNGSFGQVFIQNLRDLSGIRNNTSVQANNNRQGDAALLSQVNDLGGALLGSQNQSRQMAQNQMAQNLRKTPGTSMGLMTSVKSQNGGGQNARVGSQYTANSFNHNIDHNQSSFVTGLQGPAHPQSQSFKHNLHALMAQKGSKCKCHPADFEGQDGAGDQPSLNNIYTRNELHLQQSIDKNEQDYEEISMGSVGGDSDEVADAQEHRPVKRAAQKPKKKKFCSSYCKRIGPREQREIILECLRIEVNEIDQGQVTLLKGQPDLEQTFEIKSSFNKLQRYIIDAKWWAKWCDYSNFDQNDILLDQLDFNRDAEQNSIIQQLSEQQLNNYLSAATNRRFESTQLYQKPPRIENEGLLEQRNFESGIGGSGIDAHFSSIRGLRENLTQHYDFEALYPSMWLHLYSWYSADTQIARYLKIDSFNQEDMLGSMGSTTLKQALAEGQFKDKDGKNKFKKMELDLYPSKLNSKAFRNQFYHFEEYQQPKDVDNSRVVSSEQRRHNTGTVHTEPTVKDGPQPSAVANNGSSFAFNLGGLNRIMNSSSIERQPASQSGHQDIIPMSNLTHSPTARQQLARKGQSFVEQRPSLQGLLGRQPQHDGQRNPIQQSVKQTTPGASQGAGGTHTAHNSGAGNTIEFQQKRNSYSFNRKEQRMSPRDAAGAKKSAGAASTSPAQDHRGQKILKSKAADEAPQSTSLGQKLMSYFNNK